MAVKIQDISKAHLSYEHAPTSPSYECLQTSCMMRIADGVDIISQEYLKLLKRIAYLEGEHNRLSSDNKLLRTKVSSLKGHVTKLKNKIA